MLMFGPKPVRPIRSALFWRCHAKLLNARISVPMTSPFISQDVRLKEAPMFMGPTNVVAQW